MMIFLIEWKIRRIGFGGMFDYFTVSGYLGKGSFWKF